MTDMTDEQSFKFCFKILEDCLVKLRTVFHNNAIEENIFFSALEESDMVKVRLAIVEVVPPRLAQ